MRLDFWNRRECECALPEVVPESAPSCVSRMSPARLLANSLTDPETRGEWTVKWDFGQFYSGAKYRNEARDLTISRTYSFSLYSGGSTLSTPFTLNEAEKKIVGAALDAFNRHERDKAEAKALARLTAPREGLKPVRGETPKSGSTAKRRKPGPKGRAHA